VLFEDGTTVLGSASLSSPTVTPRFPASADVTFSTTLALREHILRAVYVGDDNFTSSTSSPLLEVVNNPAPILDSLSQTSLPEGSSAFTLTLNGSNFLSGASVLWNGTPLSVVSLGSTQIQVTVPAALLVEDGKASVIGTNPGQGGSPSLPQTFTIADAPLTASGRNLSVTGNKAFSGVVATFTDGNPNAPVADFTAIITWDDGTAQFGMISGSGGTFTVSGRHTFARFSSLHVATVTLLDKGGSTATVTDNIIDPPADLPAELPSALVPTLPRPVSVALKARKQGKKKVLVARVTFSDNQPAREFVVPFQRTNWQGIVAVLHDLGGDGVPDSVRFQAHHGKKKVERMLAV